MNLLTAENISKSYSEKILFQDICLGINEGDKIGVIGINGTGKSTLLKVIAGLETSDSGKIITSNKASIDYLPQNSDFSDSSLTVLEQIFKGSSPVMNLLRDYEKALKLIEKNPDDSNLQSQIFNLNSMMDAKNAWEIESHAKTILTKLGINNFDTKISVLSGGQKKRVALASALITPSNILILDEPTNHLDDETIEWLEDFLGEYNGALLMVTHDRFFLDKITNRMLELDRGKLYKYTGNYSDFLEKKAERLEKEDANERKRENLIRKELSWIRRGAKARSTKQKARIERFEQLTGEKSSLNNSKLDISIQSTRIGKKVINLDHINKSFGQKVLIKNFTYNILNDDRIGIIGANGSGKSTLMNILTGKLLPDSGSVSTGETVKIGYYSQGIPDMDMNEIVIEYIQDTSESVTNNQGKRVSASSILEKFLFEPSVQWTPLGKLSGGERRRIYLLKILMKYPNVLLLDEPTNDLDIETLTILEDYINNFQGAVITVSHDRYFLDKTVDKIFAFEGNGKITQYTGNYFYFNKLQKEKAKEKPLIKKNTEKNNYKSNKEKPLKFTYKEKLEFDKIDEVIENLEKALSENETKMEEASSDYTLIEKLLKEKASLEKELEEKMDRWTYLNELNEKIQENKKS
ncbi:ATP-binding cassette subfamily F protein uup [Clostridium algifaecis]|uniref:ATP-binding cassette subfamily F protein uup n=1 Tax=Clostridium algifaecis TaxID=1472040 RepID=A0ABS4KT97_9CLOT|nr:ABC-F family ATP-binding cassette domain-containing protein [Clostridium algifaecis]MBP2033272.1 ATP-binding cassette subfamily F protein uup [Clostridium algifaecis]